MLSVGELIDKLVIENIKIFSIRDKMHDSIDSEEIVNLNNIITVLNDNRNTISNYLDTKVSNIIDGTEKNTILKKIKTYNVNKTK